MAQDFERNILTGIGTIPDDIPSGADFNSDDTIIGINMANTSANAITASCFMTSSVLSYGADFTFAVTVSGGNFIIDGQTKPALTLYKGFTYTFDVRSTALLANFAVLTALSAIFAVLTEPSGGTVVWTALAK